MSSGQDPSIQSEESEVWNAISAFEAILEAMPNDRVALETLYKAYEQIGKAEQAYDYLVRFSEAVVEEGDHLDSPGFARKLRDIQDEQPEAKAMAERLETLLGSVTKIVDARPEESPGSLRKTIDITSELSLAWNLQQAGEIDRRSVLKYCSGPIRELNEEY